MASLSSLVMWLTLSEGPGWFVCQCCLIGLDKVVQVSWVRQSHQLPMDSVVVVMHHDDHRRWKVYGLYMTLGISLRIKCIVVAPHALWPCGTFGLVESMLQLYDPWVSRWILAFWAFVFKLLLFSFFSFTFFQTSNHCSECFLSQLHFANFSPNRCAIWWCLLHLPFLRYTSTPFLVSLFFFTIAMQLLTSFFLSFPFLVFVFNFLGV